MICRQSTLLLRAPPLAQSATRRVEEAARWCNGNVAPFPSFPTSTVAAAAASVVAESVADVSTCLPAPPPPLLPSKGAVSSSRKGSRSFTMAASRSATPSKAARNTFLYRPEARAQFEKKKKLGGKNERLYLFWNMSTSPSGGFPCGSRTRTL
jgi:hypothetical protein